MILREGGVYIRRDGTVTPPLVVKYGALFDTETGWYYAFGDCTAEETLHGNYVFGVHEPFKDDLIEENT